MQSTQIQTAKQGDGQHGMTLAQEAKRFIELKAIVSAGIQTAFDVGAALLEIRDAKLYRHEGHATFEDFCSAEFQIVRSRAYQLIDAAKVKASLSPGVSKILDNDSQARALSSAPVDERDGVLERVQASGKVTAKAISETVKTAHGDNGNGVTIDCDKLGRSIPPEILSDWQRAETYGSGVVRQLQAIKRDAARALEEKDLITREMTNGVLVDLTNTIYQFKCVVPHAVCTICQGLNSKDCEGCLERGFMSKDRYERRTEPKEKRRLEGK